MPPVNRTNNEADADPYLRELELELSHREYEIELLKETAQAVGSQLDLDRVLQLVADRARELIQAETLLIPVLDDDALNYTYRAGAGRHAGEIVGQTLPLDFGVCGWVWRHNRPWWRGVLDELDETERNRWEREAGTLILVPLRGKAHFLGGLAGINKVGGGDFTHRDLNLLSLFASQVSIAVENAIAYAELAKAKAESEAYQHELSQLNRELTNINSELEYLALHDQLTGLPNRSLVQDRLQQALFAAERDRHSVAVMIVDLDGFKEVNDTLGHAAGDQLLKQVAARFTADLRHTDTVGRMGGDEFALVLPHVDAENAVQVARSLLTALEADFEIEGTRFSVSASIGMALFPEHGRDAAALLKGANIAMYSAKHLHFGYALFEATAALPPAGRLSLPGDLRQALANREFELHYQPKVDLDSGRIYGVEALARWTHPQRGPVAPEEFVGVMEQTGLIRPFTLWAIEHAMRQCVAWQAEGLDLSVAVNLSMQSLLDPQFPEQLLERLGQCVPPAAAPGAGDHRERVPARARQGAAGAHAAAQPRRAVLHRRFRHRPFIAQPAAQAPGQRAEDRPLFRQGHEEQPRRHGDRQFHRGSGAESRPGRDRGGRRGRADAGAAAVDGLPARAGTLHQSAASGGGFRAVSGGHRMDAAAHLMA